MNDSDTKPHHSGKTGTCTEDWLVSPDAVDASGAAIDYGYYEIWAGAGRYMPRYQDNIADFIVGKLLELQLK